MIAFKTAAANAVLAAALGFPQLASAEEDRSNIISERQVATMGMPPEVRATIVCEGLEATKLCEQLLHEPEYRDLWLETTDKLTRVEWSLAAKLVELHGQIDKTNATLQYMIERARKLPDGRAIFRAKDGQYFDVDGNPVSAELAATAR